MSDTTLKKIIIDLELETNKYTQNAIDARKQIVALEQEQKKLKKQGDTTGESFVENAQSLALLKKQYADNQKAAQNLIKVNEGQNNSNDSLKAGLSVLTLEYNKLSEEEKNNSQRGKDLQTTISATTAKLIENEEAVGDNRRKVGDYKGALKELQKQLQGMEVGSKEFNETAKKAGELKDRINDAKQASKELASGSKLEQFKNVLGGVGSSLKNLDFAEAAQKAKTLVDVSKTITFKDAIEGVKGFGQTIINLGKALLNNPFILIGASVAALGAGLYYLAGQTSRSVDLQITSLTKLSEFYDTLYEGRIKVVKAAGEETGKIEIEQLNKSQELLQKRIAALETLRGKVAGLSKLFGQTGLNEEQQKTLDELKLKYEKNSFDIIAIRAAGYKKQSDDYKKSTKESLNAIDDSLKKQKEIEDQAARERLEANRNLNRQIQDQNVQLITDDETRELAKEALANSRAIEDIANSKANNDTKHSALEKQEETHQSNVLKIQNEFIDKRQKAFDKQVADQIASDKPRIDAAIKAEEDIEKAFQDRLSDSLDAALREAAEETKIAKEKADAIKNIEQESAKATIDIVNSVFEIKNNQRESEINDIERSAKTQIDQTQKQADAGIITRQEFETKSNRIRIDADKKESEIKKKQFESGKKLALINVGIKTAQGVMTAFNAATPYEVAAYAAIALATGAFEAAAIESQPAPAFAYGGKAVSGKKITASDGKRIYRSNGDNLLATVKTDEVILNKGQQAALGGDRTFSAIGVPGFADGGLTARTFATPVQDRFDAINQSMRIAKSMPAPVVFVQDIVDAQTTLNNVKVGANI